MTRWFRLLVYFGLARPRRVGAYSQLAWLTETDPGKRTGYRTGYLWDHFDGNAVLVFNGRNMRRVDLWFPWGWTA